jgi:glycosyltransferase involved in cell wall biosynthesis
MSQKKIIFLAPHDPRDPEKWSGTIHSIYRSLSDNVEPNGVFPLWAGGVNMIGRAFNFLLRKSGARWDVRFSTFFARVAALYLTVRLKFAPDGAIVAVAASNYVAYLDTRRPIIYISDATFQAIARLYPSFGAFPDWLQRQGDRNEELTLKKCDHIIYPSEWAARSAQVDYHVPREKIYEIPFGPNFPDHLIERYYVPKTLIGGEIRIVFVSADWDRKNGDLAVEVCRLLRESGLNARLLAIGNTPHHVRRIEFVEDRGFLRKSDTNQLVELCIAYRDSHFLLLPSTADAFGIVFSEAQAFGVPPVAFDIGGVGSAVVNGTSGILLPAGSGAVAIAREMLSYIEDNNAYRALSESCRTWYVERANWSNWSKLIMQLSSR